MNKKTAIIIGAGYGGLALANLLAKSGYQVDVYEKNESAGGRIHAVKQDDFLFDLGPSWYLMPEVFEQYYKLFGESAQKSLDLVRFEPGYKVWFEKHDPVIVQGDVEKDAELFESIEAGAGDKLKRYVSRGSVAYKLAVQYFLYNNFLNIRDVIRWPIIRNAAQMSFLSIQNLDRYVSRWFRDLRLKQLLEYHMVFLGSSPFQAPAIYSLMSHLDFKSGVYYPRRGMLSLIDDMQRIGNKHNVKIHLNSPVVRITTNGKKATGVVLHDGTAVQADVVVSNADLEFTESHLLDAKDQSYSETYWQKRQPGPGSLLVSFGVRGSLPELLHHNLYFVEQWRSNFESIYETKELPKHASIYVCNPTKTDASLSPPGHENLFVLMPLPAGVKLPEKTQSELVDKIIGILEEMTGEKIADRIVSQYVFGPGDFADRFNAWQLNAFGGESHLLRQSIIFRTANKSKKLKNLYYVGAGTLPGIGLPMCLISAQLTYKRIVGNRQPGPLAKEDI